jgi:hypothetical protein
VKSNQGEQPKRARGATGMVATAAVGASWMALVAATTLGLGPVGRVRAEISSDQSVLSDDGDAEGMRLIVQSYAAESVGADHMPGEFARPLGSIQRAITADELRRGLAVDVVQVGADADFHPDGAVVVAWIERGHPDLEFDALQARPSVDAFYGASSRAAEGQARLVLRKRSA